MNEYKLYVAGLTSKILVQGSEYQALKKTGLFEDISMIKAYKSHLEYFDSWLYRVTINGKFELAMIERIR